MAIAFVGAWTGIQFNSSSGGSTATRTVTAGNFLGIATSGDQATIGTTSTTPADTVALANAATRNASPGDYVRLQYVTAATGSSTYTVNISTTAGAFSAICAAEWSGLASSTPLDQASITGTGNSGTLLSTSVTTTQADELLLGHGTIVAATDSVWTAGASQTIRSQTNTDSTGSCTFIEERIVSSTGGYQMGATKGAGSGIWICGIATFKAAAVAATASAAPIVRTVQRRNKGQVWYRKTPPVFTAPTQRPIARTFVRRNKGVVWYRKTPPVFTAPTQRPIVRTFVRRNKGQAYTTPLPPPKPAAAQRPIVRTFLRRNRGVVWFRKTPPVFTAPTQAPIVKTRSGHRPGTVRLVTGPTFVVTQRPVVRSFLRRNRGQSRLLPVTPAPATAGTQRPIVRTFLRRNRGQVQITRQLPVFVAPTQRPIVRTFCRRNGGSSHLLTFPRVVVAPTQQPIVRTFCRRNKGQVWFRKTPPVFVAPTQRPIARTFLRRNKGQSRLLPVTPAPQFVPSPVQEERTWRVDERREWDVDNRRLWRADDQRSSNFDDRRIWRADDRRTWEED